LNDSNLPLWDKAAMQGEQQQAVLHRGHTHRSMKDRKFCSSKPARSGA
jgi:hypothetical protein